jgi:hypothetical protein
MIKNSESFDTTIEDRPSRLRNDELDESNIVINSPRIRRFHQKPEIHQTIIKKQPVAINDISVCLTEENNHVNRVNPVNLADKDWTDSYKLDKLLTQQKGNQYLASQIFEGQCNCHGFGSD